MVSICRIRVAYSRTQPLDTHFYSEISDVSSIGKLPLLVVLPGMDGTCKLLENFHSEIGKTCRVLPISYPLDRVMD